MAITSYPLAWPNGFPRTPYRETGRFQTSVSGALGNVQTALHRFAKDSKIPLKDLVISSNVTLSITSPPDPGVAIWFVWDGNQVCVPIDRYNRVENNLQAIYHVIQARRTELKHGTLELVRATFRGFMLPAPSGKAWWQVLGVKDTASAEEIKSAFQKLASKHHPDKGGDTARMIEINAAWQQAQQL